MLSLLRDKKLSVLLACVGALSIVISMALIFKAGCTGDVKTGALGDPVEARRLQDISGLFFFPGLLSVTAAFLVQPHVSVIRRATQGTAFLVLAGVVLVLLAVRVELWGVQSCF